MEGLSISWTGGLMELNPMYFINIHTLRVLPIHFGHETLPGAWAEQLYLDKTASQKTVSHISTTKQKHAKQVK